MSEWYVSKRLLVLIVAVIGTAAWGVAGKEWWQPVFDPVAIAQLAMVYIGGQSLVDFGKALAKKGAR